MNLFVPRNNVFILLPLFVLIFACTDGAGGNAAVVTLNEDRVVGEFSLSLLSSNLQWTDNGDSLFTSEGELGIKGLEAVRALPAAGLRFPGGLLSSTYDWRQGVGNQSSRGNGKDFSGILQKMVVGTGEYLKLLSETGRSGLITVNVASSADEAAAWVGYVKDISPGVVPLWEIGNESYLNQDPSFMSSAEYVKRFRTFAAAMKNADPDIKVGAILEASLTGVAWAKAVVPEEGSWNEDVIKGTAGIADFYTVHLYAPFDAHKSGSIDTLRTLQTGPLALLKNLRKVKNLISEHSPDAALVVTEFNIGMSDPLAAWEYGVSLAQATYLAQMIAMFSTLGVDGAYHWSLIGNHCFGQIVSGDDPRLRPSGMLYQILSGLNHASAIDTGVDADIMKYREIGNVGPGLSPTAVYAQGYRKEDFLTVLVVNRKPDSSVQVTFRKSDGSPLALSGGSQLTGDSPLAQVEKTPSAVRVTDVPAGPSLNLLPCSVALVRVK